VTCAVIEHEPVKRLIEELREAGIDFTEKNIGEIYLVKLDEAFVIDEIEL
jgi:hypothetical protein